MTSQLSPLRQGRITASRMAAVIGVNKYQDSDAVLRDMVREHHGAPPEFTGNEATDWGNTHEDDAIGAYEVHAGVMVHSGQEIALHPVHDFLAATPDGFVGDDGLVEVKCPFRARYTHWSEKPEYEAQIRLQLECTGRKWCDFVVWRQGQPIAVSRLDHDPDWLSTHLPALVEFIGRYRDTIASPELSASHLAPLVDVRADEEWQLAAWDYLDAQGHAARADEDLAAARDRLLALSGGQPSKGCGVLVQRTERKGSIRYKDAIAQLGPDVDLELFRAPSTTVLTVRTGSN